MSGGVERLDSEALETLFQRFASESARFSREVIGGVPGDKDKARVAELNLETAKTVFGKWCIEMFVTLYERGPLGFERLRRDLGEISPHVLSKKLHMMETQGLAKRTLIESRPPGVRYTLTDRGLTLARLGEPLFLFLRLTGPRDSR